jgi:hypothetical protein
MANSIKMFVLVGILGLVAACGPRQEEVVVQPEPISSEPTFTGKFK